VNKNWLRLAFAILIPLLILSCSISGLSVLPGSSSPADAKTGDVLFEDDFSNPQSGWDTWSDRGSLVIYQDGGLRIFIDQPEFDYWSRPGLRYADVRLEVEALKLAGPDNNDFGLICRYLDHDNYYAFLTSSDGYAGIVKVIEGNFTVLNGGNLAYNDAVHRGMAITLLRADCIGQELTFTINGQTALAVQDSDLSTGEIGLIAGTYDIAGTDILFDNFRAIKP